MTTERKQPSVPRAWTSAPRGAGMTEVSNGGIILKLHPRYLLWRLRGGRRLDHGVKSLPLSDRPEKNSGL